MNETVMCPYCDGLMLPCSTYTREGLYDTPDLVYLYKCTECGSSSPPVRPVKGWMTMGGGNDEYGERARRQAWEKAVARKTKINGSGGTN